MGIGGYTPVFSRRLVTDEPVPAATPSFARLCYVISVFGQFKQALAFLMTVSVVVGTVGIVLLLVICTTLKTDILYLTIVRP